VTVKGTSVKPVGVFGVSVQPVSGCTTATAEDSFDTDGGAALKAPWFANAGPPPPNPKGTGVAGETTDRTADTALPEAPDDEAANADARDPTTQNATARQTIPTLTAERNLRRRDAKRHALNGV
jgi:hypothetical protein